MQAIRHAGLALALLLGAATAQADQLNLANDDRLSGTLIGLDAGKLRFKTSFGQQLEVPWQQISGLTTDAPVVVQLTDGERLEGRIAGTHDGAIRLQPIDGAPAVDIPLAIVGGLNPPETAKPPAVEFSGRVNVGATLTRGNTSTDSVHADAETVGRGIQNRFTLGGEVNYARDDTRDIADNASAYARYDHFISKRRYLNSTLAFARDEFKALDLRTTVGLGLGYQVAESSVRKLSAELGLSYLREDYAVGAGTSQPAARWALDYEQQLASAQLFHHHEVFFGIEEIDDTLVQTRTGLRMPISERISGSLQVNLDYDFEVAPGADHADLAYLFKLGYVWE